MRILGVNAATSTVPRRSANEAIDHPAPEAQGGALIVIEAPRKSERVPRSMRYPSAPFVAHLLATRMQAPQTRERRRAEPDEAIAVYRSMTKPAVGGPVFGKRA
jgi:hypothetical protein